MSRENGADPGELSALARVMHRAANDIDGAFADIRRSLHTFAWEGPDADFLRAQWNAGAQRALEALANRFRDAAAHLDFEVNQQESASRAGDRHGATTSGVQHAGAHGKPVTELIYWDRSFDVSGGEGIVGGGTVDIKIVKLSNHKYEVIETVKGEAGPGAKVGIADGSLSGVVTITTTYPATDLKDAQHIQNELEMRDVAAANPGTELAAKMVTHLPQPISTSTSAGVEGSLQAGTPGATFENSHGAYGTNSADASATFDETVGVVTTPGHASLQTFSLAFAGTVGAAAAAFPGFGLSGAGSGTADVDATVTMDGSHVASVEVDGTLEAAGSTGLDFGGRHFSPTSPSDAVAVSFKAGVDMADASPEVRQLVADLGSGNVAQAQSALHQLLTHGVDVNYQVYEGNSSSLRLAAGVAEADGRISTMHQTSSGQFTV